MKQRKMTPLLLSPAEVRKLIGFVPRGLENMVVHDKRRRKLYRLREVLERVGARNIGDLNAH